MIKLFLLLLRRHFPVDEKKLRVHVMHRWDQDSEALKAFWTGVTRIPLEQFYPAYADRRTKGKPTQRADYRGVCYQRTTLQYTLQAIGEAVLEVGEQRFDGTMTDDEHALIAREPEPARYRAFDFLAFPERQDMGRFEGFGNDTDG